MKNIFKNGSRVASALITVAAGMLTDLLYDVLAEEHFEGQIIDSVVQIIKISEHTTLERICIIVVLFLLLWMFLSYGIPLVIYCVNSLRRHNIPRLDPEKVLSTYKDCKENVIDLQERVRNMTEEQTSAYVIVFSDACLVIARLHKVFCSGKEKNQSIIKNSFRSGATVNDIDVRLSPYEYLAIIDVIQKVLETSYSKVSGKVSELLDSDYDNMLRCLDDLKKIPEHFIYRAGRSKFE